MKKLFFKINTLIYKFPFCFFFFAFALLGISPTISAQTLFGETIQTIKFRLEQDTNLLPQLADRFAAGDTTLMINQLSLLYYGYAINAEYNAQSESRILDAASSLGRREKYEDAINLLDNFLEKNPGSLAALLERAYTSWLVNDSLGTVNGYKKYYQLMEVPLQSGSGINLKNPIVVSSVRDMELVMDKKGYFIKSQSLLNRDGHKIYMLTCATETDPETEKYFFFNVDLPLGNL